MAAACTCGPPLVNGQRKDGSCCFSSTRQRLMVAALGFFRGTFIRGLLVRAPTSATTFGLVRGAFVGSLVALVPTSAAAVTTLPLPTVATVPTVPSVATAPTVASMTKQMHSDKR